MSSIINNALFYCSLSIGFFVQKREDKQNSFYSTRRLVRQKTKSKLKEQCNKIFCLWAWGYPDKKIKKVR